MDAIVVHAATVVKSRVANVALAQAVPTKAGVVNGPPLGPRLRSLACGTTMIPKVSVAICWQKWLRPAAAKRKAQAVLADAEAVADVGAQPRGAKKYCGPTNHRAAKQRSKRKIHGHRCQPPLSSTMTTRMTKRLNSCVADPVAVAVAANVAMPRLVRAVKPLLQDWTNRHGLNGTWRSSSTALRRGSKPSRCSWMLTSSVVAVPHAGRKVAAAGDAEGR